MNVLIWGSDTILGHGLLSMLKDIKDGVFNAIGNIEIGEIFACDAESDKDVIDEACANALFILSVKNTRWANTRRMMTPTICEVTMALSPNPA